MIIAQERPQKRIPEPGYEDVLRYGGQGVPACCVKVVSIIEKK
jgi:hypothetical protein